MNIQNLATSVVALGLIAFISYEGIDLVRTNGSYIATNGVSVRHVVSDSAVWRITVTTEANSVKEAQEKIKKDKPAVLKFLKDEGFSEGEISATNSDIEDKFRYASSEAMEKKLRFEINDVIIIKTQNLDQIKKSRPKLNELMEQDIRLSNDVKYYYKDIDKLRVEMVNEAAKDSENRAKNIAGSVGSKIKGLRSLSCGSFSIVSDDSSITSDHDWSEGADSIDKRVRVVVHGTFNLK